MIPETALDHLALHIQQHYKTQTAAAKAWGMGVSYVSAIVNGERPIPQQLLDVIGWEWRLVPKEPQEPRPLGGWPSGVPEGYASARNFPGADDVAGVPLVSGDSEANKEKGNG